ncbi:MAG: hypothetical protein H6Q05_3216 [Acidobacteria bacterium]|nr:hypothetical protein [Acidobacteriota bacterium]
MLVLLTVTFATVFTAELIADKLFYTIGMLATRYRYSPVLCGIGLAFMAKMAAAVLLGGWIAQLPANLIAVLSAATFITTGLVLWCKVPEREPLEREQSARWFRVAAISFAAVFFSEWGDIGQVTAATLTARFGMPMVVWIGATGAMMTKALVALTVGRSLRRRVPERILRYCGVCLLLSLGVFSLFRI